MGLGRQRVLCAQGMTRTCSAVKLKASFKDNHQCQQSLPTLAQALQRVCLIFPQHKAKQSKKMDDFKDLFFFKSKVSNDVIHICDSLADFLSGTKIMLYFCYQLLLGSLQPQLRTHHSLLSVVSFLLSAGVHGTFAYRCIRSLSVRSLLTHPLVLLISRSSMLHTLHNRMCVYTTYKNCE